MVAEPARPLVGRVGGLVALGAGVVTVLLGLVYARSEGLSAIDRAFASPVQSHLGAHREMLRVLVLPTQPWLLVVVLAIAAVFSVAYRRWRAAILIIVAPALAAAVNHWGMKPAIGRHYLTTHGHRFLCYPSGHTVGLVAVLTVLALLVADRRMSLIATVAMSAIVTTAAAIGMVGLGYHYLTDVIGGVGFAVAMVIAFAALLDVATRTAARRRYPLASPSAVGDQTPRMSSNER